MPGQCGIYRKKESGCIVSLERGRCEMRSVLEIRGVSVTVSGGGSM